MATVIERPNRDGSISYLIRVSDGYGAGGRRVRHSKTWTPEPNWSEKRVQKELQRQIVLFEESVNAGTSQDGNIKFEAFAERFFAEYANLQLKAKTLDNYRTRMERVCPAIGHIRLRDLKTGHLNKLYANLQEEGMRGDVKYRPRSDLGAALKSRGMTQTSFAETTGLSIGTIKAATQGHNLSADSADRIASALGIPRSELFSETAQSDTLTPSTVRSYHRVVSTMLSKAVKWGFIPYNPALNAELPKAERKEAAHLDKEDARRLLTLLHEEPIKYRVMISFDLLSGLRRGELLGLRWRDVDFVAETITIAQTSMYVKGRGVFVDTPKNQASVRPLKLSRSAFIMLREYQDWQTEQRGKCGDYWKETDGRVFTSEDGSLIHPDTLTKWFKAFVKRNGFPDVHLHSLRHTYASLMIAEGTPLVIVSKRLGHAQVSTTSNIYTHIIKSADEKAAQVTEMFADVVAPERHKNSG